MSTESQRKSTRALNRTTLAWAFYDWANSAFALSVMAVLFPLFLGSYWSAGDSGSQVTARLAWITAGANLVVAILAPILGTIADAGGYRKRFLITLAVIGAVMTASLGLVGEGEWPRALALYLLASIGFYSSTVFYDSLLVDVTEPRHYDFVSTFGFSMGYLGGAMLLALHVWMLRSPATFGLESAAEATRYAFISVGVWWALFLAPLVLWVPERRRAGKRVRGVIGTAYRQLKATILHVRRYRNVVVFLSAYWLYVGGVFTVISMAANFGQRLGFDQKDLVLAFMITNFVGFPATWLYGVAANRYGPKHGLYFALAVYIAVSGLAGFMTNVREFFVLAIVVGCVQGGVQGLSRSLYASLIPEEAPGEFFGFYNMVTKAAHVLGPLIVALTTTVTDEPRYVLLALLPLFVLGAILLSLVSWSRVTASR
ncbi:MAG: MFS transporter [Gammaproteobacteria bacterium]|nr:MFS transporter [Gammaproteobacteria bacterium]MBT8104265.1 MFS transporter [Gammaproteobacteria bacterium]NNF49104.1 MFS transporter [Woeseiaceae bacterium]NNK24280.1 MFS transporter [Woeseiaceae bacterium]NNL63833.1 MFS transporter [Woeseiaceae bacterium]